MTKVLQNVEIIMIGSEVYYNYNGTLYTKEQFEDTYFSHADTSSKPQEEVDKSSKPQKEIDSLFDNEGNICVKLQKGDYVRFSFCDEYNEIDGRGIITKTNYHNSDRMYDCYEVKLTTTCEDITNKVIIYGRDIDRAWR